MSSIFIDYQCWVTANKNQFLVDVRFKLANKVLVQWYLRSQDNRISSVSYKTNIVTFSITPAVV